MALKIAPFILFALGFISCIEPFALDIYAPSLTEIVSDLNTVQHLAQLTLSTFLIGAGLGHIVFGPLSDKIGRRKPLIIGLIVFAITSVLAPFSTSITMLIVLRLLQGFSGAAAFVIPRAIIVDSSEGVYAQKALNIITAILAVPPVIGPIIGAFFADALGWRGLLGFIAVLSVISLILAILKVKETKDFSVKTPNFFKSFALVSKPRYYCYVFSLGFSRAALLAYISISPFLYQTLLGLSKIQYALAYGVNALGLLVFAFIGAKLIGRFNPFQLIGIALSLCLISALCLIPFGLSGNLSFLSDIFLFFAVAPIGVVFGNNTALALESVSKKSAGFASAILGLVQFVFAGITSFVVGLWGADILPLAIIMSISFAVSFLLFGLAAFLHRIAHSQVKDGQKAEAAA